MNLMGMSFRDFVWENNPTVLHINEGRTIRETLLPFADTRVDDLGRQKRKVTGEGYFTGENCWERYNALRALYRRGGAGSLRLPGMKPFPAVLDSLKLTGVSGKDLVKYAFSFTEALPEPGAGGSVCPALAGETLWDMAYRLDVSVEELTAANPEIRDVAALEEGQEVRLP